MITIEGVDAESPEQASASPKPAIPIQRTAPDRSPAGNLVNLLFISPTYLPHKGGAEWLLDDIARLCVERGHRVTIATETGAPSNAEEYRHGARVLRIRYPRGGRSPRALGRFVREWFAMIRWHWKLVRERSIDTVCVARADENAWYVTLLRPVLRFRLVVYLHGGELRELQRGSARFRRSLRALFRAADAFVAVSDDLAREGQAFCRRAKGRTFVIPNGVDVRAIRSAPEAPRTRPFVLFAGRLAWPKNVDTLVRAFAQAGGQAEHLDLVIAGTGEDRASLEALVDELGVGNRVAFLGEVERPEVHALMKAARLLVIPSLEEGHPLVALEGLAAGPVILASDAKGVRDAIRDGCDGALFDPRRVEPLARLIERFAADGPARSELQARARAVDRSACDIRQRIDDHLQVLSPR